MINKYVKRGGAENTPTITRRQTRISVQMRKKLSSMGSLKRLRRLGFHPCSPSGRWESTLFGYELGVTPPCPFPIG